MATAPQTDASSLASVELLDLRHFSARQLRSLLEQESRVWHQQLRWDYASSTELLLQYLDSRMLPGFVALIRGRIVGYCFCVYEGAKAVIGDCYIARDADPALASHLIERLLDLLLASPEIGRIESQLLLFRPGQLAEPFRQAGFRSFPRLYQECDLPNSLAAPPSPIPPSLELTPWTATAYHGVAELIHASYTGHLDALINDQYRSLEGSLRFLHNIVRFPGCGVFDPAASLLLRDRRTQTLVAVILCSRIAPDVTHITQLCVAPAHRGRGLGRLLLQHSMRALPTLGYRAITLTVSEQNTAALDLYRNAGFRTRHHFEAQVLDKPPARFNLFA
jgi:ribosomal protein S18 acetylase RimI-like enzyme